MAIPKVIHYVWVGPRILGASEEHCIQTWRTHLPGYEIKKWDESNSPMDHPYIQEMYRKKKWAFVADYIRFWVLYRQGGIYLDTDTEVVRNFDPLLEHEVFFGKTKDGVTAAGVIGALPHERCIKDILDVYDNDTVYSTNRTSPRTITDVLNNNQYENVVVYDYQYFNPCDAGEVCTQAKLALAYTNNLWAESWVSFKYWRKLARRMRIMPLFQKLKRLVT